MFLKQIGFEVEYIEFTKPSYRLKEIESVGYIPLYLLVTDKKNTIFLQWNRTKTFYLGHFLHFLAGKCIKKYKRDFRFGGMELD